MISPVFEDIDDMWISTVDHLVLSGRSGKGPSRDGDVSHEVLGYAASLDVSKGRTLLQNPLRKLSKSYAAAETLWYASGSSRVEMMMHYAPSYEKFGDAHGNTRGAYGPRIHRVLESVIDALIKNRNTRQAVVPIFDVTDVDAACVGNCPDIPCTLTWQFLIRDGKLHMIVNMRSNDVWLGFPYDVFAFTCFQRLVASAVGAHLGLYHHRVGSLHLYDRNADAAIKARGWKKWAQPKIDDACDWPLDETTHTMRMAAMSESELRRDASPYADEVIARAPALGSMSYDLLAACSSKLCRKLEPRKGGMR